MRLSSMLIAGMLSASAVVAVAQPAVAQPAAVPAKYSSSTTQMSTLLADPAAKAVLVKNIPDVVKNPDIGEKAGGMTLRELAEAIKPYAPNTLSDQVLARIDADLAQIPAK